MKSVLIFDLGLNLGFASFTGTSSPQSGSRRIAGSYEDMGRAAISADEIMSTLIARFKPDVIGYAELHVGRTARPQNVWSLFLTETKVNELALRRRIPVTKIAESEARSAMLAKVPRRTEEIKAAVIEACRVRGWPACDDHAADALCVAEHIMAIENPGYARVDPLLVKRRGVQ